jgi:hypothetical protein
MSLGVLRPAMRADPNRLRRRLLVATAAAVTAGLAGCTSDGDSPTGTTPTPPVPEEYVTATSLNGRARNPGALAPQSAVQYRDSPVDGHQCSTCRFYIPDRNGDGRGACSIVEGTVAPEGYCTSYAPQRE